MESIEWRSFDLQAETPLPKLKKRGTPLFADRPPGSSSLPRRVESKGAAGIPKQPIVLRFVGYLLSPVGRAGEAQRQSRRNAGGAKAGWLWGIVGIG